MMKKNPLYGITEIKSNYINRCPGWIVRLNYVDGKPSISKEFKIKEYGENALQEAIKYRNEEARKLRKIGIDFNIRKLKKAMKNSKSQILGVSRTKQTGHGASSNIFSWQATWSTNGKARTVQFSENKYGAYEAKQLAILSRKYRKRIEILNWGSHES